MKITILGCGSSGGVPLIGGNWGACDPHNPRNRRRRVSILVETNSTTVLVDTTPDMRVQLLDCELKKLDAVLYTHFHADHVNGIDDLRSINWMTRKPIDIYSDSGTLEDLKRRFGYIFEDMAAGHFYKPSVTTHMIDVYKNFAIGDLPVAAFYQEHGHIRSLGFRFGDFAYSTDVHAFDSAAIETLKGVKTWVVDCVREEPHPTHLHVEETLRWIELVKPERAYLTHMNHTMDYESLMQKLPKGVMPAHDGLVLEC